MHTRTYLLEAHVGRLLTEATTANHEAVFADQTLDGVALAAVDRVDTYTITMARPHKVRHSTDWIDTEYRMSGAQGKKIERGVTQATIAGPAKDLSGSESHGGRVCWDTQAIDKDSPQHRRYRVVSKHYHNTSKNKMVPYQVRPPLEWSLGWACQVG
jgi:hypothetical protein